MKLLSRPKHMEKELPSLTRIANDLKMLAQDTSEYAADAAKRATQPAFDAGRRAAETIRHGADRSQQKIRHEIAKVSTQRPWVPLAVGTGLGFCLCALLIGSSKASK